MLLHIHTYHIILIVCSVKFSWLHAFLAFLQENLSYSTVVLHSKDRYEIIGLCKILDFIKQPCKNICLEKAS